MRIWFNHWFNQAYYYIKELRAQNHYLIGTNKRNCCVYKDICDEFYVEPLISDNKKYVDWCLNFCKIHEVEVFFVRRNMDLIVEYIELFEQNNIIVICEHNKDTFKMCSDKILIANFFKEHNLCKVPEMIVVNTAEEFENAYKQLSEKYDRICIKYRKDEGGLSYKEIVKKSEPNIKVLSEFTSTKYDYDYILECLKSVDNFKDLIVMPYLNGEEVSVDCLSYQDQILSIARTKNGKITNIALNEEIDKIIKNFNALCKLDSVYNIQFRYHNNELYLLEINTRLSGGCFKNKELGVDFATLTLKKFTNTLDKLPNIQYYDLTVCDVYDYIVM